MSIETLNNAIYGKLAGDSALVALSPGGIHNRMAIQGASYPRTVFQRLPFVHGYSFASRQYVHGFYQFKGLAIDPVNTTDEGVTLVAKIVDRLVALLTDPAITVSGSTLLYCRPDREIPLMNEWDSMNNRTIYHEGVICELWLTN